MVWRAEIVLADQDVTYVVHLGGETIAADAALPLQIAVTALIVILTLMTTTSPSRFQLANTR